MRAEVPHLLPAELPGSGDDVTLDDGNSFTLAHSVLPPRRRDVRLTFRAFSPCRLLRGHRHLFRICLGLASRTPEQLIPHSLRYCLTPARYALD